MSPVADSGLWVIALEVRGCWAELGFPWRGGVEGRVAMAASCLQALCSGVVASRSSRCLAAQCGPSCFQTRAGLGVGLEGLEPGLSRSAHWRLALALLARGIYCLQSGCSSLRSVTCHSPQSRPACRVVGARPSKAPQRPAALGPCRLATPSELMLGLPSSPEAPAALGPAIAQPWPSEG